MRFQAGTSRSLKRFHPSACGLAIYAFTNCNGGELLVGGLFLIEIGVEEAGDVVMAKGLGPCDQVP
jgi:hypothetical protein